MPAEFECRCEGLSGSRALVTAAGELDIYTHPQFKKALDAAARSDADQLVVDLSGVTFMDSSALTILLSEQRRRADRIHLVITEPQLLRILEVMGYIRIFSIHAALEDAVLETGRLRASRAQPCERRDGGGREADRCHGEGRTPSRDLRVSATRDTLAVKIRGHLQPAPATDLPDPAGSTADCNGRAVLVLRIKGCP